MLLSCLPINGYAMYKCCKALKRSACVRVSHIICIKHTTECIWEINFFFFLSSATLNEVLESIGLVDLGNHWGCLGTYGCNVGR